MLIDTRIYSFTRGSVGCAHGDAIHVCLQCFTPEYNTSASPRYRGGMPSTTAKPFTTLPSRHHTLPYHRKITDSQRTKPLNCKHIKTSKTSKTSPHSNPTPCTYYVHNLHLGWSVDRRRQLELVFSFMCTHAHTHIYIHEPDAAAASELFNRKP